MKKKFSQETMDKVEEMLKQGVIRETIAVTCGISTRDISAMFGGKYRKPSTSVGVPDPTPEEIAARKFEICGRVTEPYYRYD